MDGEAPEDQILGLLMRTKTKYDRFPVVKRGYDPLAVESHLEELAAEMDQTLDEAAAQIAALEGSLEQARSHEEAVHLTILAAPQTKQDMLEVAERQAEELKAEARQKSDQMMTYARMQAFQVVTEARTEAEAIVAEARVEAASLARAEAATVASNDGPSEREAALQQRIDEMQAVIEAMETEIINSYAAAMTRKEPADTSAEEEAEDDLAETPDVSDPVTDVEVTAAADETTVDEEDDPEDIQPITIDELAEEHLEIIVTDTAPVTVDTESAADSTDVPETVEVEMVATETEAVEASTGDGASVDQASGIRRSFYSRRSAKLPRIGVEAGRGAMAAAAGLRPNLSGRDDEEEAEPAPSPEYEAV